MNPTSAKVLRYLTGNENIEHTSISELQKLADESPYFPVAQFLLSKKLEAENHNEFLQQVQKTALYFTNPYWLHYQLSHELWSNGMSEKNNFGNKNIENSTSIAGLSENKDTNVFADELTANEFKNSNQSADEKLQETNEALAVIPGKEEVEVEVSDMIYSNSDTGISKDNIKKADPPEEEMAAVTRDTDAATEEFLNEADTREGTFVRDNIEQVIMETQIPASTETTEVLEEMAGVSRETDETAESFLNEVQTAEEETSEQHLQTAIPPFTTDFPKGDNNPETAEPDEHERMFQNIKAMLEATTEEAEADVENAAIPIDPYYTIDYFASQGIKLDLEPNPKDQLGQHLKKFTHWLKHMKKLGPEDATEVIRRTDTEADIQKIAESSNTVREVVTEAMASVLEKQGKNEKAIELYKKLSFLNPHKSAYFADKIKNLKSI